MMDDKCCPCPPRCLILQRLEEPLPQCHRSLCNHRLQSAGCLSEVLFSHSSQTDPGGSLFRHQMKSTMLNIISLHYAVLLGSLSPLPRSLRSLCCCSQTDRAVQLLLETSADNPSYYCDSLKACLVTTITSSGPSQSTIKLVATNMIANGKLAGIVTVGELLYLMQTALALWASAALNAP